MRTYEITAIQRALAQQFPNLPVKRIGELARQIAAEVSAERNAQMRDEW